jgi:hypothetical protein
MLTHTLAVLALAFSIDASESVGCPSDFSRQLAAVKDWNAFYSLHKKCPDDGEYGEAVSNAVVVTLANRWSDVPALGRLIARDTAFRRVVFRHIDATTDEKDLRRILSNAQTKCPAGRKKLCSDIGAAAKAAIADL